MNKILSILAIVVLMSFSTTIIAQSVKKPLQKDDFKSKPTLMKENFDKKGPGPIKFGKREMPNKEKMCNGKECKNQKGKMFGKKSHKPMKMQKPQLHKKY